MKNSIILFSIVLFFASCQNSYDKKNFDLNAYIQDNKEGIIKELKYWKIDTAYIQFVGFAEKEKFDDYEDLVFMYHKEQYFGDIDIDNPIFLIHYSRIADFKGNRFNDGGIKSSDLVDYQSGVGVSDANTNYSAANYEYSDRVQGCGFATIFKKQFVILNAGYPEQVKALSFIGKLIAKEQNIINWEDSLYDRPTKEKLPQFLKSYESSKFGSYFKNKEEIAVVDFNKTKISNWVASHLRQPDSSPLISDATQNFNNVDTSNSALGLNIATKKITVLTDKAFFFNEPDFNTKRKGYLIKGQSAEYQKMENNFVYVIFTNDNGQKTEGWLSIQDLILE